MHEGNLLLLVYAHLLNYFCFMSLILILNGHSELGTDYVGFARAPAWVSRYCDFCDAEGMQVVTRDLCSLCWSLGVAFVAFWCSVCSRGAVWMSVRIVCLEVWTCGTFLLSGGCISCSYCCRGWLLFWSLPR